MVLSKIKREVGKVKMIAEVEVQRSANIKWVMENRVELTDNYPNRWLAVDKEAVQIVDIELFPIFKIMDMRGPTSSVVFYLCNDYQTPVLLVSPQEVWQNVSE
jgi:hypothetical protein|tara:strand:+ start:64 stop:372 length:309 start_codon:yes stop_codon:yes gene_type:complete